MGVHKNVGIDRMPKQGTFLGKRVKVVFNYGVEEVGGRCIRDDVEEPGVMIFALDDERVVLAAECQYQPTEE